PQYKPRGLDKSHDLYILLTILRLPLLFQARVSRLRRHSGGIANQKRRFGPRVKGLCVTNQQERNGASMTGPPNSTLTNDRPATIATPESADDTTTNGSANA
ncbi:MAG: hypothetical protein KIH65_003110, partial [Candidatus Uhrbacteria bacterium]|nr:hypothetical protein [Candidatus Uhrbacteria bacterium]